MKKIITLLLPLFIFIHSSKSQTFTPLGSSPGTVWSLDAYGGNIIAGGDSPVAEWIGTMWDSLGTAPSSAVWALINYNGNLYAGGGRRSWNGATWSTLTGLVGNVDVEAFAIYNGNLYAAGFLDSVDGKPYNIAEWNGTTWSPLGLGITGVGSSVWSLAVYNGELYAGGIFDSAGGKPAKNIAKWDGTNWSLVDS